jgi:hypothetical protein
MWLSVVVSVPAGITITCLMTDDEWSLAQVVGAFVVGQAAMWLLMPLLESRHRMVTFFKALPALAAFSLLAYVPTLLAKDSGWIDLRAYLVVLLGLASLAATLALTLGGISVRRRFGRVRLLCWLSVWTVLAWTMIASPFIVIGSVNGHIEWGPSVLAILCVTGISLALLLPLLLLSFFQPFYRARFFSFLKTPEAGLTAGEPALPRIAGVYQPEGATTALGTVK